MTWSSHARLPPKPFDALPWQEVLVEILTAHVLMRRCRTAQLPLSRNKPNSGCSRHGNRPAETSRPLGGFEPAFLKRLSL